MEETKQGDELQQLIESVVEAVKESNLNMKIVSDAAMITVVRFEQDFQKLFKPLSNAVKKITLGLKKLENEPKEI